jgi:hypothetical protein
MKYLAALTLSGLAWTALAFALGHFTVSFWLAIAPGVLTAFCVGFLLKDPIKKARGWGWFVLPFASIALGTFLFGAFFVSVLWVASQFTLTEHIEGGAIWVSALLYAYLSLTVFVWVTYPASLLTHYLLRRYALPKAANLK